MEETLEQTVQKMRENYYMSLVGVQIRNPLSSFYIDYARSGNIANNVVDFKTYIKPTNLAILVKLKRGRDDR
jgi:hypothetical protein